MRRVALFLFGYDTYPSLQSNLLGTNYSFHNPCDQIRIRGEIMSRIHENIRNTIINNTEKRNFRQNLHRKDKIIKTGDRVLLRNNQKSTKLDLSWLGPFKVLDVVKNKAILDVKDKQLKVNISHLLPLKNCRKLKICQNCTIKTMIFYVITSFCFGRKIGSE